MSSISTRYNSSIDLLTRPKSVPEIAKRSSSGESPISAAPGSGKDESLLIEQQPGETHQEQLDRARQAAEGLVATSFLSPILKQIRESNNAAPPFGPTQAEKQFGGLLDNRLADEISHAAQFPLVERLVEQFTRNLPAPEQGAQPEQPRLDLDA